VLDLYRREPCIDEWIPYTAPQGRSGLRAKLRFARWLATRNFDCAILFQNAFEAALIAWAARIPRRIGYARDGRSLLLTDAIPVPKPGQLPPHERYYYLELLRRAGLLDSLPQVDSIRLEGTDKARQAGLGQFRQWNVAGPVIGVSPGAAYGGAKRWLPERFAEAAASLAQARNGSVAVFGAPAEADLCARVAEMARHSGARVVNLGGATDLNSFIDLAAACDLFLTNDSGAMHIAAALGVPTVAVFGATDPAATGPAGPSVRVVREPVECAPCLLRECPIDHRCMVRVTAARVVEEALGLLEPARSC
jgi:heptosyltransferase-2